MNECNNNAWAEVPYQAMVEDGANGGGRIGNGGLVHFIQVLRFFQSHDDERLPMKNRQHGIEEECLSEGISTRSL